MEHREKNILEIIIEFIIDCFEKVLVPFGTLSDFFIDILENFNEFGNKRSKFDHSQSNKFGPILKNDNDAGYIYWGILIVFALIILFTCKIL